jgi:hypothetical protein
VSACVFSDERFMVFVSRVGDRESYRVHEYIPELYHDCDGRVWFCIGEAFTIGSAFRMVESARDVVRDL